MSKEATKKFVENNGFICNKCGKVIVDGHKHKNEKDLCDQCKIADLEAKLAESEDRIRKYIDEVCKSNVGIIHLKNQLKQAKEKLSEKEEQIFALENQKLHAHNCLNKLKQQLSDKEKEINKLKRVAYADLSMREIVELKIPPKDQDKISFAVDKLKEVKKLFEEKYTYDVEESDYAVIYEDDVDVIIDNQIKMLKEGK